MSDDPSRRIVSDTGPLISLEKISGGYQFIRRLYDQILVPPVVLEELAAGAFESVPAYLQHYEIEDLVEVVDLYEPEDVPRRMGRLDVGEQQAIRLAQTSELPLLIEEQAGREVARELGLSISGIAGQILRAVREEILTAPDAKEMLVELRTAGRINRQIFEAVHTAIGDAA